ncbi:ferredoxin [Mycobacterium sherrisii]|uniref:ferredoxin n=1 Tax=Mycobacterium sherrisii TaxID=243061 RepID=UPI0039757EF6
MPSRLRVNSHLCQGHGVCVDQKPQEFDFDDDTAQAHSRGTSLPDKRRSEFEDVAHMCPTAAIELIRE